MIEVFANRHRAICLNRDVLTTGSVGYPVKFSFSMDWDDLSKVAVFRGSRRSVDVILDDDGECCVPPEVLSEAGGVLSVGVYGTDGDEIVIPTVYVEAGLIEAGAEPTGVDPEDLTPSILDQFLSSVEEAREAAMDARSLARRLRTDADDGVFDGLDGISPTVTITDITGGHRVTITDEDHPDGQSFDVLDGAGASLTVDAALSGSSTNPVQNKVVKAALDAKGSYSKPSGGIPKTDLASDVQTSLGKADTALQQHQDISGKLNADQGVANAGKFLTVGSDGIVAPVTMSAWQGGNY